MKFILRATYLSLVLFFFLRVLFYWYNITMFEDVSIGTLSYIALLGMRFDFSTVLYCFGPFFLLSTVYFLFSKPILKALAFISYCLTAAIIIAISIFDTLYFEFSTRRSAYDSIISIKDSNNTFVYYFFDYWRFILLGICLIVVVFYSMKKIKSQPTPFLSTLKKVGLIAVGLVIYYIGMIGLGPNPLSPLSALYYVKPYQVNLVTNTAQTVLYSILRDKRRLVVPDYFSDAELDEIYSIKSRVASSNMPIKKTNVVIFILESFSRDVLTNGGQYKAKTPFLDSLMAKSLVFENSYANGTISSFGIVSVLGSIPPLIENPYYISRYNNNKINGIGDILGGKGFISSFFLGTVENSFGFEVCTNLFGIKKYYSQEDFSDYKKHLSPWGVFDKPYFQFVKETLDKQQTPFFSTIFNVSSHHPYILPKEDDENFNYPNQTPEQNTISYVDYALAHFFEEASNESWFENTLFIFVADHWGRPSEEKKKTIWNRFEIPLFFYHPNDSNLVGRKSKLAQQLDVLPTILDYIDYDQPFMSFGKSLLESSPKNYVYSYHNSIHRIADDSLLLGYNTQTESSDFLYNYKSDTLLKNNMIDRHMQKEQAILEKEIKARIQRYALSLSENKLYIE
jgi:phosphoglycerol transferase MdoB-like AlkP superfamily enzyme